MSRKISQIESLLNRFHPVVYISAAALVTAMTIFIYYTVFLTSENSSLATKNLTLNFDKKTIEEVEKLHNAGDPTNTIVLPDTRYNPFVVK